MTKKFTLIVFTLLGYVSSLMAAGPTVPSSNLSFPSNKLDGDRFTISFNKGNGAFRLVVVKEGSPLTTTVADGTDYTSNNLQLGTPGTAFHESDGFVVFRGSNAGSIVTLTVTGLRQNTTYYVSIWEFNGSGTATEYLTTALTGSITTKSAPSSQASISSFTNVAGNRLTINWSGGNGEKTLLLARKGAPVNAAPEQLKKYVSSTVFGSGSAINGDNYVLYAGSGSSTTISNLEPNTIYHFAVFAFNGTEGPVYTLPGNSSSQQTYAGPTQASGTISVINVEGNRLTLSFAPGNGKYQLIVGRKGQPVTAVPENGQTYTASTDYGAGYQFATGDFVLNSTGSDRTFTNLDPSSTYYFRIYDFDIDADGNTYYLGSSWSEKSGNTAFPPTTPPSDISFENITGTSVTMKYTAGQSAYRLIVMKAGSPVDATPADLTRYNGNANFGQGTQITPGNYVIYGQTNGSGATISGLTPGITYSVAVWGFNGNAYPVYGATPATASVTIPNQPTTPGTGFSANTIEGNSMRIQWQGGDGARRLVIARKGAPVTATPTDGVTYLADSRFQYGDQIAPGEYVVYDGVNRVAPVENLETGAGYYFAIFEYNLSGGVPDYLSSSYLQANQSTAGAPALATSGLFASDVQGTQAKINLTPGDGNGRLFLMRAGSPVNVEPQDLLSYDASGNYGSAELGNTGNFIVQKSYGGTSFNVSGLTPNTHYYVSAYEFNGVSAPVYLRPGTGFDFTTTGSGVVRPSANATNPVISLADGNKISFQWSKGDGAKRIVVMRQGSPVSFTPSDGAAYSPNSQFGEGTDAGSGQYVVYDGTGESVTVTNLLPATDYYFAVFEYNGTGSDIQYLTTGQLAATGTTAVKPSSGSSQLSGTAGVLSITLSWNNGPGAGRLLVMKEGSLPQGEPADLSKYLASPVFTNGSQLATGEYAVYNGSGNTVTVTGLEAGKTYYYSIFEYNGVDAPVYNTTDVVSGSISIESALPLKWLSFAAKRENNCIHLSWSTSDEINTRYFIVERSIHGGGFTAVDSVLAQGNPGRNDYRYDDCSQLSGELSYRIKQVDVDNRYTYSTVILITDIRQQPGLRLYPNPASSFVRIQLPAGLQQATVQLLNGAGLPVKTLQVSGVQTLPLQGLPKGIYYVIIKGKKASSAERLLVQ
ncbi:MAG TPA: T9SS type A sorting domain-containing protein [Chitinophagaceae bacterium]|nr:T9SS type A sorting domain-containing protein [Chitinophagaceae bacterium]